MKVALLTAHLSEAAGGLRSSVPGLARALADANGLEVRIVGVRDRRAPNEWPAWGPGVITCSTVGPRAFAWSLSMIDAIGTFAPDVIDVQGLWTYPSLASLRWHRRARRPYVITPHGMLDPWALRRSAWKKRIVRLWFEDQHLRGAACLRATSAMEAEHFRAFGLRNPIAIVANGIDLPVPQSPAEDRGPLKRMLFLSRIHPKKGLDLLLRSWSALERRHDEWELVIAGPDEGSHEAEMRRLATKLHLKRVGWRGAVYGHDKSALYRSADLFVLPTHAENFGLVVAEALAHQVPVITTRNAPWHGLEAHGCGWWIELSEAALMLALDEAMGLSEGTRRVMGARGRAWVEEAFAWPSVARQMAEVYEWVAGGGAPPASVMLD